MASSQQVCEFSHAFLNGERGWCVVLKIYMDETNTHDKGEMVAVGAYLSRPKHWGEWTKAWNVHKRRVPAGKKPIKVFHATDCAGFFGEFDGWTKEDRDPYVAQLLPVIPANKLAGIVIGVHRPSLEKEFKARPELREMFGDPYDACFQWALTTLVRIATERGNGERMAFIHEINAYQGAAIQSFDYVRKYLNPRKIRMTLGFGGKEDYAPLQAADILAYEGAKYLKNPIVPRRAWTALDPNRSRLMALRYGPDNMGELSRLLTEHRADLLASGWDGKVA